MSKTNESMTTTDAIQRAEKIYRAWETALQNKDVDGLLRLYDADASIESPIIRHLLGRDVGIVQGHADLRHFFEVIFAETPSLRNRHRASFFTDGSTLIWEYPRTIPGGEQVDMAEVLNIDNGLIHRHRVYWGWGGLALLASGQYKLHRDERDAEA
jgi:hypothetical protein